MTVGPKMVGGVPRAAYIFMSCFHCEKPWCVAACPTKAMQKRPEDGIVFVDHEICVGCKACIRACPWGAPQWHMEAKKVVKCDYCKDRVDQGLKPACVTICITGSLSFGDDVRDLNDFRRRRHAEVMARLD
jgi:Fe-S-cluster-containing dehydrogenase component